MTAQSGILEDYIARYSRWGLWGRSSARGDEPRRPRAGPGRGGTGPRRAGHFLDDAV